MAAECTYCEERFNSKYGIHVKCQTCQDMKLCLDCFSAGAEIGEHSSDHPYELVDSGSFSIIDESWKAYEELALLEAIELYGIGSWTDIANAVGGERTPEECSERYLQVYVENFFGRSAWNAIDKNLYTVIDHTCLHDQPLSPSLSLPERDKIVDISREQQIRLGYMPKRDDFEREYDNDAELLVSRLAVNANDDTELDQNLKIAHINMYTDKLRERFRRKRIVLEYNIVKLFFHMHPEENGDVTPTNNLLSTTPAKHYHPVANNMTTIESGQTTILKYFRKVDPPSRRNSSDPSDNSVLSSYFSDLNKTIAERDFNTMEKQLRIFCQFSSAEDHNRLIRNLAREKELKAKIKELQERKRNGTKTSTTDPGWRLLSEGEKKLCKSTNLKPAQYIDFKAALIKDCQQKKKKGAANKPSADSGIDKNVKRRIIDFLTRNNWIKV
jgi:transcriptional adapter 2-beta